MRETQAGIQAHEPYSGKPLARAAAGSRANARAVVNAASRVSRIPCRTPSCGVLAWPQRGARAVSLVLLAHALGLLTPDLCIAQVQLPAVNLGETNFEDGFAAPGVFAQVFPDSYVAGERRDGDGNRIPGQVALSRTARRRSSSS